MMILIKMLPCQPPAAGGMEGSSLLIKNRSSGGGGWFPGGLVVRILSFHCCGLGSIPGRGTEIL